jgi:O-acetyl-ADP-ribose deacetylase (regulator of RNase III)
MPIVKIVQGDITESGHPYIAHQCNCVTVTSRGLAASIATKFPWADVYSKRKAIGRRNCAINTSLPGTIEVLSKDGQNIVCMFAQWTPGKCGNFKKTYPDTYQDTSMNRQLWFKQCLDEIDKLKLDEIAIPYLIGCGLAGGNWGKYQKLLNTAKTNIVLYSLATD